MKPLFSFAAILAIGLVCAAAKAPASAPTPPPQSIPVPPSMSAAAPEPVEASDPFTESYRTAVIAYNHGDLPAAKTGAEEAQKIKPDEPRIKLLLGRIALAQEDYTTAEKEIKEATSSDHPPELAYEFLGDLYLKKKDYLQARDAYTSFLTAKPKNPDGILKLIYSQLGQGNMMAAGEELLQLDPYNDVNPGYYFAKAALAEAEGKPAQSEKHLQMARTMYGNKTFAEYMKVYLEVFPPKNAK